jgi:hypothetical protein
MRATRPDCRACRATSATLNLDSGKPGVAGSSQASALISTVSSGGKGPGTSWAVSLVEARQSLLEEALAPLADNLAAHIEPSRNLVIADTSCGHQDHLGTNYLEVR